MKIQLCQDAEAAKSGDKIDVPAERAKWLIAEGYATDASGEGSGENDHATGKDDPTDNANAVAPNVPLHDQLAAGLGLATEGTSDDVRPVLANPDPIEAHNKRPTTAPAPKSSAKAK